MPGFFFFAGIRSVNCGPRNTCAPPVFLLPVCSKAGLCFATAHRENDVSQCSGALLKLQLRWRERVREHHRVTPFGRAKKNALA